MPAHRCREASTLAGKGSRPHDHETSASRSASATRFQGHRPFASRARSVASASAWLVVFTADKVLPASQ